ncbi:hypothetical protein BD311DRAFT_743422 [Dichomitus squalens]|uniref:Uncharacterized protein n=1 Tax=Dichomitus squalens TaxID=114155 RepID=A0A4V2JYM4_9APHY|nr:hypothetical protein BD311DRAFT_743422 [Dichomitus squalens]
MHVHSTLCPGGDLLLTSAYFSGIHVYPAQLLHLYLEHETHLRELVRGDKGFNFTGRPIPAGIDTFVAIWNKDEHCLYGFSTEEREREGIYKAEGGRRCGQRGLARYGTDVPGNRTKGRKGRGGTEAQTYQQDVAARRHRLVPNDTLRQSARNLDADVRLHVANIVVLLEKGAVWSAGGLGGGNGGFRGVVGAERKAGRGCHGRYAERGRDTSAIVLTTRPPPPAELLYPTLLCEEKMEDRFKLSREERQLLERLKADTLCASPAALRNPATIASALATTIDLRNQAGLNLGSEAGSPSNAGSLGPDVGLSQLLNVEGFVLETTHANGEDTTMEFNSDIAEGDPDAAVDDTNAS